MKIHYVMLDFFAASGGIPSKSLLQLKLNLFEPTVSGLSCFGFLSKNSTLQGCWILQHSVQLRTGIRGLEDLVGLETAFVAAPQEGVLHVRCTCRRVKLVGLSLQIGHSKATL